MDGTTMTASQIVGRALALPSTTEASAVSRRLVEGFEFVLVSNAQQYGACVEAGAQPILVTRSFSVTDSRGRLRLLLGGLLVPWRWRRVLLNQGISSLEIYRGRGAWQFSIAAKLVGVRVRRLGKATS